MSISQEHENEIRTRVNAVEDTRKAGMAFEDFVKEYARYLAQAEIDKDDLLGAGFSWEDKALYDSMLFMLSEEHADRILAEGVKSAVEEEFDKRMPLAKLYEKTLYKVGKYIAKRTSDTSFLSSFKQVKIIDSDINSLSNIIVLAELVATDPEMALKIKPGKVEVNEGYLSIVKKEAHELIALDAQVDSTTDERSIHVEIQRKLITICLDAIDDIIEYADSAFLIDRDYFNEHYTNHVRRERYKASLKMQEDVPVLEG